MTDPLSLDRIQELMGLEEKRTQGEWIHDSGPGYNAPYHSVTTEDEYMVCECWDGDDDAKRDADAAFIASLANDAKALLSMAVEWHRMREALAALMAFAEDAETRALVGDEGCIWAVEAARAALGGTDEG